MRELSGREKPVNRPWYQYCFQIDETPVEVRGRLSTYKIRVTELRPSGWEHKPCLSVNGFDRLGLPLGALVERLCVGARAEILGARKSFCALWGSSKGAFIQVQDDILCPQK